MNNSEIQGVSNSNVDKMESCVLEDKSKADDNHADRDRLEELKIKGDDVLHKIVETLVSSSSREHNQGDGDWASAHGLQEIKAECGLRKKKRRSKKKLNKSDSEPNNVADKLKSCVQEKSNADEELKVEGDSAPNNIVEKLDQGSFREQNQGDGDWTSTHGLQEVKFEVGLKKKKRRPKRKKESGIESTPNNILGKLESSFLKERCKVADHNADQHKFEELKGKGDCVPHNIVEMLESRTSVQQSDCEGEHADGGGGGGESACVNGLGELKVEGGGETAAIKKLAELKVEGGGESAGINGLGELKVEVGLRKKKRKPKKKHKNESESESAPNNIVEKLETSILKERSETHNADKHKFEEIKVREDSVPHNIVEKLESRAPRHQSDGKGEHADGCGGESAGINELGELKVEVESKRKRERPKKRKISEGSGISHNNVENLLSSSTQQQNQVNDQADADGLQEMKADVGPKKKKRRSKKSKLNATYAEPINIVDKLECSRMEKMDGNSSEHTNCQESGMVIVRDQK